MAHDQNPVPRFGTSGNHYARFRPSYPDALYEKILFAVPPPLVRAVDLGAGTGLATNALAPHFEEVIAVEPDAVMLAAGRFAKNVKMQNCTAEEADIPRHSCALVTSANAFYWMDGESLLPEIQNWLAPGSVFAAWRYCFPRALAPEVDSLLQQELRENWDAHRHARLRDEAYTLRTVQNAALFRTVAVCTIENISPLTAGPIAGFFASTSYAGAYARTQPDSDAYFATLGERIGRLCPGDIDMDFGLELVLAQL